MENAHQKSAVRSESAEPGNRIPDQKARIPGQTARIPGQEPRIPGQTARIPGQESLLHKRWRAFRRHRMAIFGTVVVAIILLATVLAPLSPYDPNHSDLPNRLKPPTLEHPMGTDDLGRDLLTRVLFGGRVSMAVGVLAMSFALLLGTLVGGTAGYYGGTVDTVLMRIVDFLMCFPGLFVLILLTTLLRNAPVSFLSEGIWPIVFVIAFLAWMQVARLVRSSFLSIREKEFIEAARCIGATDSRIMWLHILPNSVGPIIVIGTLRVAFSIVTEAGLSFLGFGVQPPTPTWGNMLRNAQSLMLQAPWVAIFPGLMIFITVIGINYIGDGLRDALDPQSAKGSG